MARNVDEFSDMFSATTSNQASKVIARFGGVPKLVSALNVVGYKISRFSVYKWTYPKIATGRGGTGGVVPKDSKPWVIRAAKQLGVVLRAQDWDS